MTRPSGPVLSSLAAWVGGGAVWLRRVLDGDRRRTVLAVAIASVAMFAVMLEGPVPGTVGLVLGATAAAGVVAVLGSPLLAVTVLVVASFLRTATNVPALPTEPMVFAVLGVLGALTLAWLRGRVAIRVGVLELAMLGYLVWNLLSVLWPHELGPDIPATGQSISVYRFILTGTVVPFLAYVAGRAVFRDPGRVRVLLLTVLGLAAWSALVSIAAHWGPRALVWPSYVLDSPMWPGRAVGIVNQPAVNGLILIGGFLVAMFVVCRPGLGRMARTALWAVATACVVGVYLTYTRGVWAAFAVGVLLCAVFARGYRAGFVAVLAGALGFVAATWSTFTSSDREAGGVGSVGEVQDRLNTIATSLWGIEHKPLFGWGIGRFTALNTYHHQVWDQTTPFRRGFGISSHQNELGIGAELGIPGLMLWLAVLCLTAAVLLRAVRRLPVEGVYGRALGLIAVVVLVAWVVAGLTVDLRFHDFGNLVVFLLVGAAVGVADGTITGRRSVADHRSVAV